MSSKRIIAFSLWGQDPKYTVGALKNAKLAPIIYPGWICRFYVAADTPSEIVRQLRDMNHVEVVLREEPGGWRGSVWRFLPAAEPDVEVMLSRDTDSRLGARERAAVDDWLASDLQFHIMRDHPFHSRWPILAGMWGVRGGVLKSIPELLHSRFLENTDTFTWGVDQVFLGKVIHPLVRQTTLIHDEISPVLPFDASSERRPFPTKRLDLDFVGQVFDAEDRPVTRYSQALGEHLHRSLERKPPQHP